MKYIVQYTLPYEHLVQVGIEAESQDVAIVKAQALFDQGDIWNDTAEVPLLVDDYVETSNVEVPLTAFFKRVVASSLKIMPPCCPHFLSFDFPD